jgi:hypothetical protein
LVPDPIERATLDLPSLESFTEDEELLARVTIGIVRAGGAMYTGRFLECVAARVLDAAFPTAGISPWDLLLADGTHVEIRSGTTNFSLSGRKTVDVWIFVHKSEPDAPFTVLSSAEVEALPGRSVSCRKLAAQFGRVPPSELPDAVRAKARPPL